MISKIRADELLIALGVAGVLVCCLMFDTRFRAMRRHHREDLRKANGLGAGYSGPAQQNPAEDQGNPAQEQ